MAAASSSSDGLTVMNEDASIFTPELASELVSTSSRHSQHIESRASRGRHRQRKSKCKASKKKASVNVGANVSLRNLVGQATFYATGLGACGWWNKDSDYIAAASELLYDTFEGGASNPNNNPICGRMVLATYQGKSVKVKIVDRCVGCAKYDLDFSPAAFAKLANPNIGRLNGMTWSFI